MKFSKLLLLFGLLLCLVAPVSAWEQSFEGNPKDLDLDSIETNCGISASDNGSAATFTTTSNEKNAYIIIDKPWTGYVAFTAKNEGLYAPAYSIGVYINGSLVKEDFGIEFALDPAWKRIEFVENEAHTGINCYINGELQGSLSVINPSQSPKIYIDVNNREGCTLSIDDISSDHAIVACQPEADFMADSQYFRAGYNLNSSCDYYVKLFDPAGTEKGLVYDYIKALGAGNTPFSERSIPMSVLTSGSTGTYRLVLFRFDPNSSKEYYLASGTFSYYPEVETGNTIQFDSETKKPGETLHVYTHLMDSDLSDDRYYVTLYFPTANGQSSITEYNLTSADQVQSITIPNNAASGIRNQYLFGWNQGTLAWTKLSIVGNTGVSSIGLDKTEYFNNDTVRLSYYNLPPSTNLGFYGRSVSGSDIISQSWTVSGTGVKLIPLSGTTAERIYIIAQNSSNVIAEGRAVILSGDYFLSGKVYDASNNAPLINVLVNVDGTMVYTDSSGAYDLITSPGLKSVILSKSGYQSYSAFTNISKLITHKNFYIAKNYTAINEAHTSLYGVVTDRFTGSPISGAFIQIKKGDVTHSQISSSSTGAYTFDSDDLAGTWIITVSKSGYDTYTYQVTVSGDTYYQVTMVNKNSAASYDSDEVPGYDGSGTEGGSNSSDASIIDDTGVSQDRPGREAAKNTMEQFESLVPSLIGIVIFRVLIELLSF